MASVVAVAASPVHRFSKVVMAEITLLEGLGVAGDAHAGRTVRHRSRVARDPMRPNLRQVHLVQSELLDELAALGFSLAAGDIGENVLTAGVDLLGLSRGTRLALGEAVVEVTGLRNPCSQLDRFRTGLTEAVLDWTASGRLVRKAGIMGVVVQGGRVRAGDVIGVDSPALHEALRPV